MSHDEKAGGGPSDPHPPSFATRAPESLTRADSRQGYELWDAMMWGVYRRWVGEGQEGYPVKFEVESPESLNHASVTNRAGAGEERRKDMGESKVTTAGEAERRQFLTTAHSVWRDHGISLVGRRIWTDRRAELYADTSLGEEVLWPGGAARITQIWPEGRASDIVFWVVGLERFNERWVTGEKAGAGVFDYESVMLLTDDRETPAQEPENDQRRSEVAASGENAEKTDCEGRLPVSEHYCCDPTCPFQTHGAAMDRLIVDDPTVKSTADQEVAFRKWAKESDLLPTAKPSEFEKMLRNPPEKLPAIEGHPLPSGAWVVGPDQKPYWHGVSPEAVSMGDESRERDEPSGLGEPVPFTTYGEWMDREERRTCVGCDSVFWTHRTRRFKCGKCIASDPRIDIAAIERQDLAGAASPGTRETLADKANRLFMRKQFDREVVRRATNALIDQYVDQLLHQNGPDSLDQIKQKIVDLRPGMTILDEMPAEPELFVDPLPQKPEKRPPLYDAIFDKLAADEKFLDRIASRLKGKVD